MDKQCDTHPDNVWFVRIDKWHPTRLNQLITCHWATAGKRKKHDQQIISLSVLGAAVPKATRRRRVSLEITLAPRQRAADPDAYWKSTLDALVKCGALVNDSRVWCELGPVEFQRGTVASTVIKLEDLQEPRAVKVGRGEERHHITPAEQRESKKRHRVSMV